MGGVMVEVRDGCRVCEMLQPHSQPLDPRPLHFLWQSVDFDFKSPGIGNVSHGKCVATEQEEQSLRWQTAPRCQALFL